MRKQISVSLSFILLLLCICFSAIAVNAAEVSSGKCGDNLQYSLSEQGVLTISGQGKMWDFRDDLGETQSYANPWESKKANIKKVIFNSGITYIGANAFWECENLAQVTFTDTITSIGPFAFYNCTNLENFVLPPKLEALGQEAFAGCKKITRAIIPDTVISLDCHIFHRCDSLTDLYIGGSADADIYSYASAPVGSCVALEEIKVSPNNKCLTAINGVLYDKDVTRLVQYPAGKKDKVYTVPASVQTVWRFAVWDNPYIETVVFSENLGMIDVWAFDWCENLKNVHYAGTKTQWAGVFVEPDNAYFNRATISYQKGCEHKYTNACDAACNACYETREISHNYVTGTCTICGNTPASVKITKQPVSVTVAEGVQAKVTVTATGDGLTYRWYVKSPGATGYTYTSSFNSNSYYVTMNSARDGRRVLCMVYDQYGNKVQSASAALNMQKAVKITQQPVSVTVAEGKQAKVTVKATGDGLTYRWYVKNPGASSYAYTSSFKGNSYYITMNVARSGRRVLCIVYDKYGNKVQSASAALNMQNPVKITKQPVSVTVAEGAQAKVTVQATGDGLTYRWYIKNPGATGYTYTSSFKGNSYYITMNAARSGRRVLCMVYDQYGNKVQSASAVLKIK